MVLRRSATMLHAALLLAALAGAAHVSRAGDWEPVGIVVVLAALAVGSDLVAIETQTLRLSGAFISIVVAMAIAGPAPAVAIGVLTIAVDTALRRPPAEYWLSNASTFALFPLAGGLLARAVDPGDASVGFGLGVFAVFVVTNLLNFGLIAVNQRVVRGRPIGRQVREMLLPMLPSEALAAALAVSIAVIYRGVGFAPLVALVGVLFLFQLLTRELVLSQRRAEQLQARTEELGSLQVGVLATLVQTLSLRDRHTARHSAAVARYARAIAAELGRPEVEQELVHTAGLLHDIGKFAFPDSILLADTRLSDEDWEIVKQHPAHGARLVRRVDGYGPVADVILAHHERIDGRGYPHGLAGEAIPLLSRIISVADTYDVMTARDSYRRPVSRADAVAELRRVSGTQLDGSVVEAFVRVLEQRGLSFQHTTDADFEAELQFDRRVRAFAVPAIG